MRHCFQTKRGGRQEWKLVERKKCSLVSGK